MKSSAPSLRPAGENPARLQPRERGFTTGVHTALLWHGRFAIPAHAPGLLAFYLHSLLVPHSRREMVWARLGRSCPAATAFTMSFVGGRRSRGDAGRGKEAIGAALEQTGAIGSQSPQAIMLVDYGNSARGKTIFFFFEQGADQPRLIAKTSSVPEQRARLAREQAILCKLHLKLPTSLRDALPAPLGEMRAAGANVFAESYVGGKSMYLELRNSWSPRSLSERHFQLAGNWLQSFQRATAAGEVDFDEGAVQRYIVEPLDACCILFNEARGLRRLREETVRSARSLTGLRLPLTSRHGDFWARNIMLTDRGVRVIDWEGFKDISNPFHDWFHFAVSYGLSFPWRLGRWDPPPKAFRSTFASTSSLSRIVQRQLRGAADTLGASRALLDIFFPAYLAEQAVAELSDAKAGVGHANGLGRWSQLLLDYARADQPSWLPDGGPRG